MLTGKNQINGFENVRQFAWIYMERHVVRLVLLYLLPVRANNWLWHGLIEELKMVISIEVRFGASFKRVFIVDFFSR